MGFQIGHVLRAMHPQITLNSSSDNESFNLSDSINSTPKSLSNHNEKAGCGHNVIKVAVINTSGISSRAKSGEFKACINVDNPDVIVACETNIMPDMVDSDFLPNNYTATRDDKCGSKGKGIFKHGIFIAHRNNLVVSEVAVIDKTSEFVLARLQIAGNSDLYLGSFYRHTKPDPISLKVLESTSKGKAQILTAQYASVFQDEGKSGPPDLGNSPYPSMPKIDVSVEGVKKLLLRLNPTKAVGPDMVPTRILKDYADDIVPKLQSIFQQSLDTGMVPENWKKANVTAVFKKGNRQVAANYCPVSLACVSCKALEHIVFRAIMDHVDFHKILVFFQHGFSSKHSCETQLVNIIEDLATGLGSNTFYQIQIQIHFFQIQIQVH